jgi:hypothetical protein
LKGLAIASTCIIIISIIAFLLRRRKKNTFETFQTEKLFIEDIIKWYREPSNISLLEENPSAIAVLLRNKEIEKIILDKKDKKKIPRNISYFQGIFDKSKNKIIKGRFIQCNSIEKELEDMFNDKDMIIFS